MAVLQAAGVTVSLPAGWEGELTERPVGPPDENGLAIASFDPDGGPNTYATIHLANFPLPTERGDFGSGAVDLMSGEEVLVVLFEYGSEAANTPLYAHQGVPLPLDPDWFSSSQLRRPIGRQVGWQGFFTANDRAFCVYVVLGDDRYRTQLVADANELLSSVRF